jgi:tetratricopeptide (TPR) repeat protein
MAAAVSGYGRSSAGRPLPASSRPRLAHRPLRCKSLILRFDFAHSAGIEPATHCCAVGIQEKALGAGDPDVAQTLNALANVYQAQGKYAEAEELYQRCILERTARCGGAAMLIKNSARANHGRRADTPLTGRKKRARRTRGKSDSARTGEGSTPALQRDEVPVAAKDNQRRVRQGESPSAGPEHHQAITDMLRANGCEPAELVPEVVQRAAEIYAREGAPPDGAFVLAFTRELVDRGYLDPDAASTAGAMARDKQGRLRRRGDDAIAAYRSEWYPHSMENSDRLSSSLERPTARHSRLA